MQIIFIALAAAALIAWGFFERSGRLSCKVDNATLTAQVDTLSNKLDEQNKAVETWEAKHNEVASKATEAAKKADALSKSLDSARASLKAASQKPTPKGATCEDAWREVEKLYEIKK